MWRAALWALLLSSALGMGWYADTQMPRNQLTAWLGFTRYVSPPGAGWHNPEGCSRVPTSTGFQEEPDHGVYGRYIHNAVAISNHVRSREALIEHVAEKLPYKLNLFEQLISLTGYTC